MARLVVLFVCFLSSWLRAQAEIPYAADILRVSVIDAAGGVWKNFDNPPFPALKDIPLKAGTVLAYPKGRMPEIYSFADGTAAPAHWTESDIPFRIVVSRCDTLQEQTFRLEAVPFSVPETQQMLAPYLHALEVTDARGAAEFHLAAGRYHLRSTDSRFLFYNDILEVPGGETKITALLARPVQIRTADEKGATVEGCRIVYSIKVRPYGKACTDWARGGGYSGDASGALLPVMGKMMVHAWCPGRLPLAREFDLGTIGSTLRIEGGRAGIIAGEIIEVTGNPRKDVTLALYRNGGFFPLMTTRTDARGFFQFEGLPEGRYLLTDRATENMDHYLGGAEMPLKLILVKGSGSSSPAADMNFQLIALPPPSGVDVEQTVELEQGQSVHLNFETGKPRIWEGRVADRSGRKLAGATLQCDGVSATTDAEGLFHFFSPKARLGLCTFTLDGFLPLELRDVEMDKAPKGITLSGSAVVQAEIRWPAGIPFTMPPEIQFLREGQPLPSDKTVGFHSDNGRILITLKAELEEGPCVLSLHGEGLKTYTSNPVTLEAGKPHTFGAVELEAGTAEPEAQHHAGSITISLADRSGAPAANTAFAVMQIRGNGAEPGMAMSSTDAEGRRTLEDAQEILNLYAEGPGGYLFADGPALAPCNQTRACRLVLNPPNTLAVTIRSLEPGTESFEITVTTPLGIARQTATRDRTVTFPNSASPADITIRADGKEIFTTQMVVKDGGNELNL